jgi:putative transposase
MPKTTRQLRLELAPSFGWGGERARAGRKPEGAEPGIPHRSRDAFDVRTPVHVTLRTREGVPSLRCPRFYRVIADGFRAVQRGDQLRVVHFCLMTNHLHLVVEAESADALGRAMRALSIRLSLRLNALLGTRGRVLEGRYRAHALRTPTEARNAVAYVVGNFASHAQRGGAFVPRDFVDPYSSAADRGPDGLPAPVSPPRSWLLATATVRAIVLAREPEAAYAAAA